MWEINLADQITSFALSLILGVAVAIVFYTLESFRLAKHYGKIAVWINDTLFFVGTGFITFCLLIARSNGEIRGYIIVGEAIGFWLFRLLIKRKYVKILTAIIRLIDCIFSSIYCRCRGVLLKIGKFLTKSLKFLKNIRKKG